MEARPSMRRKSSNILATLSRSTSATSAGAGHNLLVPDDEPAPPLPTVSGLETVRSVVQKRLTTWGYLKRAHEGRVNWFNTILLSREDLDGALARGQLGGVPPRTHRLAVLGMSLSSLLDINNPSDFLRGLSSLMSEFEGFDGEVRPKTGSKSLLRPMKPRKSGAAIDDEFYLVAPNIVRSLVLVLRDDVNLSAQPFELDYFQVLFTLCDILIELYSKVLGLLGAAPPVTESATGVPYATKSPLQPPPPSFAMEGRPPLISPSMVDMVYKIDNKLKKAVAPITKELDGLARKAIQEELTALMGGAHGEAWDIDEML